MRWIGTIAILSGFAAICPASEPADAFLQQYAQTSGFRLGTPSAIALSPQGEAVFFLRAPSRSFVGDLFEFDVAAQKERVILTAEKLLAGQAENLTVEEKARRERMRSIGRGIASFQLSSDGRRILVPLAGRLFVYERKSGAVRELTQEGGSAADARFSPNGDQIACVRNGDLYVIDVASNRQRRLTTGATESLTRGLAEFVAQEEMDRFEGYWWSPDGRSIAYQETDASAVETLHIADPAHPERTPNSFRYPRAGKNNAKVRLGIISVDGGPTKWIRWDYDRFPYLATVRWEPNSPLTALVQNRNQTEEWLLAVDERTGECKTLLQEVDPAWINLDQSCPRWIRDGAEFLWSSERNGQWRLERRGRDGRLISVVSPKELGYRSLIGVDEKNGAAWVAASPDPTELHAYRVPLDATRGEPQRITKEPGLHALTIPKSTQLYVDAWISMDGEPRWTVHQGDGARLGALHSVAEKPTLTPQVELTLAGTNPSFHTAVVRPKNFQASRRYPVLVSVYGGPHAQTVQKSRRLFLISQWLADHGFIVVSIDGRGTPGRGRAWERTIKGDFLSAPMADQVAGLQAVAAARPEMDLSRVGIFGWSFGGYFSAMAVMQRPDVFHAAVAGAPVGDWLDYDTHYTERYLGLPSQNPNGYKIGAVPTHAAKLSRPLLLMHGTADDNVYLMHSLKISDALFRAGKRHEFLPLVGFTHRVIEPAAFVQVERRKLEFFQQTLMGKGGEKLSVDSPDKRRP